MTKSVSWGDFLDTVVESQFRIIEIGASTYDSLKKGDIVPEYLCPWAKFIVAKKLVSQNFGNIWCRLENATEFNRDTVLLLRY